jgi:hypothetical protein
LFGSRGCDDWQRPEGSGDGEVGWCAGGAVQVSKVGSPFALDTADSQSRRGRGSGRVMPQRADTRRQLHLI